MTDDLSLHPGRSKHTPIQNIDHPSGLDGVQLLFRFENNYGASVIHTPFSYGIEAALIYWEEGQADDEFEINYEHEIVPSAGVFGHLTLEELETLLDTIKNLPVRSLTTGEDQSSIEA